MSARIFLDPQQIVGRDVHIAGSTAEHLVRVLRVTPGDTLIVQPGDGTALAVVIREVAPSSVHAEIQGSAEAAAEVLPRVTIYQALMKGDRFETVLQRCTEIGAVRFVPMITERTVRRPDDSGCRHQMERWQAILRSAAEQCERADIPQIETAMSLNHALISHRAPAILLSTREGATLHSVLEALRYPEDLDLFVGPEGGWADSEVAAAMREGAAPARLGTYTLRTETAALVALSQILYAGGRLIA